MGGDAVTESDHRSTLPFPKRWIAYIVLKLVVIALAVAIATKYQGLW
jgi:hypothetical protein